MGEMNVLPLWAFALIAGVSGAVGIWLQTRRRLGWSLGLGAVGGVGSLLVIPPYVAWRSQFSGTFFSAEFLLPIAVVGLPLLAVWKAVDRGD